MAVKQGAANMTRKPSASEREKIGKKERTIDMEKAANLAPVWEQFPGIADDLPVLAAEYISINQQVKELEDRKKEIRELVETIHQTADEPVIAGDFFVCEMVTSHTAKKVDPKLLLQHGVSMETIDASYTGGTPFKYLQVRSRG